MDRRTFLKTGGAAVATTATSAHQAVAQPAILSRTAPLLTVLGSHCEAGYLRDVADRFALKLRQASDDRIRLDFITVTDDGFAAVRDGRANAYFSAEADHIDHHPALTYFGNAASDTGLKADHYSTWLSAGGGQMHWDDLAYDFGIKTVAAAHTGRRNGLWCTDDLSSIADFSGRTLDGPKLTCRLGAALGLSARQTSADGASVVEAMMGATAVLAMNRAPNARIWFRNGFHPAGLVFGFGLARSLWDGMPQSDQALVNGVAFETFHSSVAEHNAHDQEVLPHLLNARGIRADTLPDDVRRAIAHVSDEHLRTICHEDGTASRVHDSFMTFRKTATGLEDPARTDSFVS